MFRRTPSALYRPFRSARSFSILSEHACFPATLFRFQPQRRSSLIDFNKEEGNVFDSGVLLSEEGLASPRVSNTLPYSNGARFMPNTFFMQKLIRICFDEHLENIGNEQADIKPVDPVIVSILRGTTLPSSLILFREHSSRFSLQPSKPISLKDLNSLLDEFYSQHGSITTANEWLDKNEYHEAIDDEAEADWMRH